MKKFTVVILFILGSCGKTRFDSNTEKISSDDRSGFWNKSAPYNLDSIFKLSKEQNKPVLLYFTGFGSINCRKMENDVFAYKDIYDLMHEKFIPFALYVDDKTKLDQPSISKYGIKINDIGDQNQDLQQTMFSKNYQPYIVTLRPDRSIIADISYTRSKVEFKDFLTNALRDF